MQNDKVVICDAHGNQITVRTLDLNNPFAEIAEQLNTIAKTHFDL